MGGGRKRGRTQRRHFKQSRENVWRHDPKKTRPDEAPLDNPSNLNPSSNPSWEPFVSRNPGFEEYYKEQRIVPEDEWEEFLCLLRKPLPAAFRINASGQFSQDIRSQMENDFVKSLESEVDSEYEVEAIRPLLWYPDNLAWHLNFSRMQLRKNQTLERFHEFLKQENEVGNITRQEAVSMVPPLFLDVLPDHYILDMCAAPGSKTFQLLEIIHQRINPGLLPNGLVIANDVDVQRCNLLIHQTKRMCSANLIVTNHEAQHFPSCSLAMDCLNTSKGGQDQMQKSILQFDRVLCDVPCSGDGTLRKAPDIWRKWNAGMGNGLHRLQVEIAMRGIALLKVGGRMVYSTCSMNPVENEAVVAEVLRRSGGSIQLLDVSSELPELVRRPGLKIWKVRDKGIWLTSYQDVPTYRRGVIVPSMFPFDQSSEEAEIVCHGVQESLVTLDSDTGIGKSVNLEKTPQDISRTEQESNCENMEGNCTMADIRKAASESEEIPQKISCVDNLGCQMEVSSVPLERCMRILPHDQNSGAFFIAVLQKLSALQAENYMGGPTNNRCMNKESLCESLEDEQKLEITPFEDIPSHNHVILPEAASDTNLVGDQASTKSTEVGQPVHFNNVNSKDDESKEVEVSDNQAKKGAKGKLQIRGKWKGVDPVVFFKDETTINSIRSFYGISESFVLDGRLVSRNNDANHVKRIYYISKSVHDILQLNFQVGQRLKITSLGLKIFERQTAKDSSSPCVFRLSSEGLPLLLPYISRQILFASLADFRHLLQYRTIKFGDFVNAEFGDKASKLMSGCCVVVLNEGDRTTDNILLDGSTIAIVCWKGKTNISVMVSQMDGQELLERLSIRFGLLRGTLGEGHKDTSSEVDGIKDPEGIEQMEYSETADRQTVCQAE